MTAIIYLLSLITGIFLFGNAILVPFVHLGVAGEINYLLLFVFSTIASTISDSAWYFIGRVSPKGKILKLPFLKKRIEKVEKFSGFFDKHSVKLLFYSRFVWGTRIATRLLSGMQKVDFAKYIYINTASSVVWLFTVTGISLAVQKGITPFKDLERGLELGLVISIILVALIYIFIKKILERNKF
jgi:membrane protein DedA with SNARE-associated domain